MTVVVIRFTVERRRGVAAYQQLVEQVKQATRTGALRVGDQLPTAKEVAETCAVNPNTTLKAYRELEREGLVELVQGRGTFVREVPEHPRLDPGSPLVAELASWLDRARLAGLDRHAVQAALDLAWELGGAVPAIAADRSGETDRPGRGEPR
ncbi:GntR family transcriptional regulator [Streptomyces sp. DSM 44915]|uniref:GntR family transcriptional regulator n=1 Tax=Streptomyces chisholmiae TaxID=3075540 RepID=A0ABU2JM60_9ACTN|nr:GntR family transcriptional regulator [Streptomyces sp. DSM 44915]MDT0266002.1 GntR family transcriptional regulator [Streptomyces sp. DSM 44915]